MNSAVVALENKSGIGCGLTLCNGSAWHPPRWSLTRMGGRRALECSPGGGLEALPCAREVKPRATNRRRELADAVILPRFRSLASLAPSTQEQVTEEALFPSDRRPGAVSPLTHRCRAAPHRICEKERSCILPEPRLIAPPVTRRPNFRLAPAARRPFRFNCLAKRPIDLGSYPISRG